MFFSYHNGKGHGSHPKLCRWHEEADAGLREGLEGSRQKVFAEETLPQETDV